MARIALIDADDKSCEPLVAWLAELGHQVLTIRDGSIALDTVRSQPFELVILCVEIPHLSGYTLCNKLKRDPSVGHLPLLLTSSVATVETFDEHKRLRTRADAYAHKPFDLAQLAGVFAELLSGRTADGAAGQTAIAPYPAEAPPPLATRGITDLGAARLGDDPSVYDISSAPFLTDGADEEPAAHANAAPSAEQPDGGRPSDLRAADWPRRRRADVEADGPSHQPPRPPAHEPAQQMTQREPARSSERPAAATAPLPPVDLLASTQVFALREVAAAQEPVAAPTERSSKARARSRRGSKEGDGRDPGAPKARQARARPSGDGADADFLGQTRAALAELAEQVATLERERDSLRASEQALQEKVAEHRSMALALGEQVAAQKERVATLEGQVALQQQSLVELAAHKAAAEASASQLRRGLTALLNSGT